MMKLTIFYSWQSDIEFNNKAIRESLRSSANDLERLDGFPFLEIKDSTSNLIGATRIPDSILADISASDIFICDLSIVGQSHDQKRKIPNPNVLIELGFAISKLGWSRIVVLFNGEFGDITDVPFDIEKRSVLLYKIKDQNDGNGKGQLKGKLKDWLQKIVTENPDKPTALSMLHDEKKRAHDIKILKKILRLFKIAEMDNLFDNGYARIGVDILKSRKDFSDMLNSTKFYVYDQEAKRLILDFELCWKNIDQMVKETFKKKSYQFEHKILSTKPLRNVTPHYVRPKELIAALRTSFSALLMHIRNTYLEINIGK